MYYLDHFRELLEFVETYNAILLENRHFEFISRFRNLKLEDQCLFVRLANRKGRVFRLEQLRYEEIPGPEESIQRLKDAGFFRTPQTIDFEELLGCFPRQELAHLVTSSGIGKKGISSAKKRDLIGMILAELNFDQVIEHPVISETVVVDSIELEYLLFLYFGRLEESLGVFALRDLGIMRTRRGKKKFQARFGSRDIATAAFLYSKIRREIRQADQTGILELAGAVENWPVVDDAEVHTSRNKTLYRLGREIERIGLLETAVRVYEQADQFPATERAVRVSFQLGDRDVAERKLLGLIDSPSCDEELIFAEDFYERKFGERKVGKLTEVLRNARIMMLDESGRDYPEAAVISSLQRQGSEAWHVENFLWSNLFGVVFWDQLFDEEYAAFHSDFDRLPDGLNTDLFYTENREFIEGQLGRLGDEGWLTRQIAKVSKALETIPNCLVVTEPKLFQLLESFVKLAPVGSVEQVLREMAQNFKGNRSGFPDLIVFENGKVLFLEVKSEGDQIQRHQLARMEQLRRAGFSVEVARVQWSVDPDQIYVVVDVETTGGLSSWNRVTEIGAVKVRGGKVIDEWSSLINPGRKIPRKIVQLTGISDEMVASAPTFSEIADEFREFVGESVFVGHRVKFDFGFIREEYRRLEREFRAATFCTVVETRRYFPGLKSYGLANLCQEFDIPLATHHRALCDARATAQILLKINAKRREILSDSTAK